MRDILVVAIFFSGLVMAMRRPYVAALLWVWIGLMNPHRMGWGFAYSLPLGLISAVVLAFSIMANPDKVRWPKGATVFLLILLTVWMGVTTLGAIALEESLTRYIAVLKVFLMTLMVAAVVKTREEILGLVIVVAGSIAFFGTKGGIFTIMTGGSHRVWGPTASVIEGNNELAVALIITVPLLYFLAMQVALIKQLPLINKVPVRWIKQALYAMSFFCLIAALGTHSRGALLAMSAMVAILWWHSKSKLALGILILTISAAALFFMPEDWTSRMNTIGTYEEDNSAMGRINAWTMAVNIANDRFLGAGFATDLPWIYQHYAPNPGFVIVAHSIYFQILGEHGYIGLFLYLGFWFMTYRLGGKITKLTAGKDDLQWANMLGSIGKVSLIGFAVGGAFLSLAYWDMPFYIMVILLCTERLVANHEIQAVQTKTASNLTPLSTPKHDPRQALPNAIPSTKRH